MSAYPLAVVGAVCDTSGAAPDTLLSAPISKPVGATVIGTQLQTVTVSFLASGSYLGIVPDDQMEAVSRAIRLSLDLSDQQPGNGLSGQGWGYRADRSISRLAGFRHARTPRRGPGHVHPVILPMNAAPHQGSTNRPAE
ncbi:hypothetical protein ACIQ9Q_25085 [Streptomyces sp. NPDC094438]|uniref:hypothetical protein n=1 Tax=Streptomyces sp. NPDC094438 TaxID=3366061 RepID=UPI003820ACBA